MSSQIQVTEKSESRHARVTGHPCREAPKQVLRVVVAVLTYRRPEQVREHLPQVIAQVREVSSFWSAEGGLRADVGVVVIDNDPEGSARDAVRGVGQHIDYVIEPTPGIAAARNRALVAASEADLLVFIDDDERPRREWLASLLNVWIRYRPAAVPGRVVPTYQVTPDPWILAGRFFNRPVRATGTSMPSAAAGNLLLDLSQVRDLNLKFEEPYGMTGGEDSLFGCRLVQAGRSIVWCHESVVEDVVPAERLTRSWVLQRAWSLGNLSSLVDVHLQGTASRRLATRARRVAAGGTLLIWGASLRATGWLMRSQDRHAQGYRMQKRGSGMAWGALGRAYEQYRRDGRRPGEK